MRDKNGRSMLRPYNTAVAVGTQHVASARLSPINDQINSNCVPHQLNCTIAMCLAITA